jgi:hypothetical protein
LVVLAVLGCGGNKNECEVSGTVTYQGKPLPMGTVSFLDSSNQWLASSPITKGKYTIKGKVPVGPVKITVTTPGSSPGKFGGRRPNVGAKNKFGEPLEVIPIPAKYSSAGSSGLTYTVQPGPNEYNIDLP